MKFKRLYIHPEEGEAFEMELNSKITVLLGKNGDGKTTMMRAIEQELTHREENDFIVINDDAANRGDTMHNVFDPRHIMASRFSSEGETLINTIGTMTGKIGAAIQTGKSVVACFDKADSGLSIDRIIEFTDFLHGFLVKDVEMIVISANSYELASQFRGKAEFIWVKDKKFIELPENYEDYIKMYEVK